MEREIFDVCDEYGNPTGETVSREKAHAEGICHRTAHVWICDPSREYVRVLLQKRAEGKDSFPGCYDTSAAGHIRAGDEPLYSAQRELKEELGITAAPEELQLLGTFRIQYEDIFFSKCFRDNEVAFVYLYDKPIQMEALRLQKEEVESVKWFGLDSLYLSVCAHNPEICVPAGGLQKIREHYYPHCSSEKMRIAEEEINQLLCKYGPECRIYFLRTAATIINSWKVTSKEERHQICRIIADTGITDRSFENLSAEWELHNVSYHAHIGREHAKDVDLDYEKDPRKLVRVATELFDRMDIE